MKSLTRLFALTLSFATVTVATAQQPEIDFFRTNDKQGLNVFETKKAPAKEFKGLTVRVGGDFALQLQGLRHENNLTPADTMADLGTNFNLPSANLNMDIQLAKGARLHMRTYLSARHHNEAWVKGGYMQIDDLDFISEGFLADVMKYTTIRAGMDEYNYGDTHFRRSDNARAIFNPFVGNYIMDSFSTEPFAEVTVQYTDYLLVLGWTNGRLNQNVVGTDNGFALFGKLGYDRQINEDLRVRLTGSIYNSTKGGTRDYLYGGDRAGSRYYRVLDFNVDSPAASDNKNDFSGRFNPGFAYHTAFQINPFVKYQGLEFFGVIEKTSNGDAVGGAFTQLGAELLYRFGLFGHTENFYLGGRYNSVTGNTYANNTEMEYDVSRINIGGGWFMTDNVLTKIEYVTQSYDGSGFTGRFDGAKFNGFVVEAVISF